MNTHEVQAALFRLGFDPWGCDGIAGLHTQAALLAYQKTMNFAETGTTDATTVQALQNGLYTLEPFIQAKSYRPANRPHSAPIQLIVIHTMEAPEKPKEARNVAQWFAGPSAPQASAHYCVDDAETIACVLECDVAWGAPGANARGVHLEHAGYAGQASIDWHDLYSRAVLDRSARLAARVARRWAIPAQRLSVGDLAAGASGIIGHVDASNAFENGRGHVDPGPSFPWDDYIAMVRSYL